MISSQDTETVVNLESLLKNCIKFEPVPAVKSMVSKRGDISDGISLGNRGPCKTRFRSRGRLNTTGKISGGVENLTSR